MVGKKMSGKGEYAAWGTRVRVIEILDREAREDLADD